MYQVGFQDEGAFILILYAVANVYDFIIKQLVHFGKRTQKEHLTLNIYADRPDCDKRVYIQIFNIV